MSQQPKRTHQPGRGDTSRAWQDEGRSDPEGAHGGGNRPSARDRIQADCLAAGKIEVDAVDLERRAVDRGQGVCAHRLLSRGRKCPHGRGRMEKLLPPTGSPPHPTTRPRLSPGSCCCSLGWGISYPITLSKALFKWRVARFGVIDRRIEPHVNTRDNRAAGGSSAFVANCWRTVRIRRQPAGPLTRARGEA